MTLVKNDIKAVVIGGSAGSFQVVVSILKALPKDYKLPIILSLHRLRHVREGFVEALSIKSNILVKEPEDKERLVGGVAYLAPSNYHMYIELDKHVALSTEETVNFSRPSIDITLGSAGYAYKDRIVGIILSGANKDGALGLQKIKSYGGLTLIQCPSEARVTTMPLAAKEVTEIDYQLNTEGIINYLKSLSN